MVETKKKTTAKKTTKKTTKKKTSTKQRSTTTKKKTASKQSSPKTTKKSTSPKSKAPEVTPEINIGLVGHVDHGKTTLTEALSGRWTDTHSEEMKRGITIRLGYANTDIYYCKGADKYTTSPRCMETKEDGDFVRRVSFVDAPGHESLMATMLAGTNVMDAAILMVSATEHCPQPQTKEHLIALQIAGIKNVIIIQNKIDLVSEEEALHNYQEIKKFLKGTPFESSPVIPISARFRTNIDVLLRTIQEQFITPERNQDAAVRMSVTRSFDINKPGSPLKNMKGGVLGGALLQGKLTVGDEIEIGPGIRREWKGKTDWIPMRTTIKKIMTGNTDIKSATPGGSIALLTTLDPSQTKSDSLSGSVVSTPGNLPPTWTRLTLSVRLLKRVVGSKETMEVDPLKLQEILMLNTSSAATIGIVSKVGKDEIECSLKLPLCSEVGSRVTISRRVGARFRLIGYGIISE